MCKGWQFLCCVAGFAAGLAYCIACSLLGKPLKKQPGGTLLYSKLRELQRAAAAAAKGADVFLLDLVASLSIRIGAPRHPYIMPDLVTFLAAGGRCDAGAAECHTVEQLLLFSCTAAGKPTAQLGVTTSQLRDLITKWVRGCRIAAT